MSAVYRSPEAARAVAQAYTRVLAGWPVPHQEIVLPTAQGETFVVACGPRDAPPLILLHGSQANAAAFLFDAPAFAQDFRVYAVDMIGEPGRSAPVRPPLAGEAHALWLDEVLAGLGVERAAIYGVSLGGWLALDYARRRPGKVSALALNVPAGIGGQKNFLLKAAPLMLLGPWGAAKVRELVFGPAPADVPAAARPFVEMMGVIGRGFRPRVETLLRLTDAELAGLAMPIWAVFAGRDVLLDGPGAAARLQALAPHAEVILLPEARHFIPGQAPAVAAFLKKAA